MIHMPLMCKMIQDDLIYKHGRRRVRCVCAVIMQLMEPSHAYYSINNKKLYFNNMCIFIKKFWRYHINR